MDKIYVTGTVQHQQGKQGSKVNTFVDQYVEVGDGPDQIDKESAERLVKIGVARERQEIGDAMTPEEKRIALLEAEIESLKADRTAEQAHADSKAIVGDLSGNPTKAPGEPENQVKAKTGTEPKSSTSPIAPQNFVTDPITGAQIPANPNAPPPGGQHSSPAPQSGNK